MSVDCPFCNLAHANIIFEQGPVIAIHDRAPASPGHTLILPRRHVTSPSACTAEERLAIWDLADRVKEALNIELQPDGYNLGFNEGTAAGQTVSHVHLHVIPRFHGDVDDPRGGIRQVLSPRPWMERAEILTDGDLGGSLFRALAPLVGRAQRIDVVAAFVQDSGLQVIEPLVRDALARGAAIRVLTGDYLHITQGEALRRLLDWSAVAEAERGVEGAIRGHLQTRVVETERLGGRSFHPKAWHLEGEDFGVAFVGSSNLSRSALHGGVEWNMRVDRHLDAAAWARVAASFGRLWEAARPVDVAWIDTYAQRVAPELRAWDEEPATLPVPTPLQQAALEALAAGRAAGRRRALIVMATGLGKTVLAAHEVARQSSGAVLWLAHRRELLEQAADTVRLGLPSARFGWLLGGVRPPDTFDVLFASVATLARPETLHGFARDRFAYVVIDEVHHADAPSYRRILDYLQPGFLLGLTATPDRADGGDVPGLFDDHVAYRADLGLGISEALLVPFRYLGLADTTNYEHIPWRNRSFDLEALSTAVETQARMEKLWQAWTETAGTRSLVFCVSVRHATFVRDWLAARGVRVRLCHGSAGSDDRTTALLDLERGDIDAICSVDLFNEGIDCRPVDRVVMLRPTESPVLFLQQLGRGLRRAAGKGWLQVIDMVGNHKVFLDRVRTLLQIGGGETSVASFLERGEARWPPGCSVQIELEAVDLLRRLLPAGGGVTPLVAAYREIVQMRGERPTAGEMVRRGFSLRSLVQVRGGWFGFVGEEGDLLADEAAAVRAAGPWLLMLQTLPLRSCLRMVLLEVLVEGEGLRRGLPLTELARSAREMVERSPELREEVGEAEFSEVWQTRAVDPWLATPWFRREGERLQARFEVDDALVALTRELVDARLAMWRRDRPVGGERFDLQVGRHRGDPCLVWSGSRMETRRPTGDLDVRLGDGSSWRFRFVAEGVRVAHGVGRDRNGLPDLLREWFGPAAEVGRSVRFRASPDGWWVEPLVMETVERAERVPVCAFPSLMAAAGWLTAPAREPESGVVLLPGPVGPTSFAVRVFGSSMDGGPNPLREGDWAIFEPVHDVGLGALEGRVALVDLGDADAGMELHIKRIVREGSGHRLRSDNPEVAERPAEAAVARARLVRSVRPEALAPAEGAEIGDLQAAFGLSAMPEGEAVRVDGHLFLLASGVDVLKAPDRWARRVVDLGPGETAYVCARSGPDRPWHYLGVGRWSEQAWNFPAPSLPVWRTLSTSRSSSRTLPPRWRSAAEELASHLEAAHLRASVVRGTQRAEILGRVSQGGLRIGGPDRATRTVSLTDLGWALAAEAEVRGSGSPLDEAQVNRLRYLDGTPKEATRWIDTGWALGLLALVRSS